jgi:hypothetical protein
MHAESSTPQKPPFTEQEIRANSERAGKLNEVQKTLIERLFPHENFPQAFDKWIKNNWSADFREMIDDVSETNRSGFSLEDRKRFLAGALIGESAVIEELYQHFKAKWLELLKEETIH